MSIVLYCHKLQFKQVSAPLIYQMYCVKTENATSSNTAVESHHPTLLYMYCTCCNLPRCSYVEEINCKHRSVFSIFLTIIINCKMCIPVHNFYFWKKTQIFWLKTQYISVKKRTIAIWYTAHNIFNTKHD
jgi:hypothetical protein